jgi:hypothetical protein
MATPRRLSSAPRVRPASASAVSPEGLSPRRNSKTLKICPRPRGRQASLDLRRDGHHGHPVEVGERHVGHRRGQPARVVEARPPAEAHGRGDVEDDGDGEVLLLLVALHQEALGAAVDAPVEGAQVVAGGVRAVVRELDAAARDARAPLGPHAPREEAPRGHRQVLQLALEGLVEELGLRGSGPLRRSQPVEPAHFATPPA